MFEILNLGHCDLFVIWDLKFGIFYKDDLLVKKFKTSWLTILATAIFALRPDPAPIRRLKS